jgi:uncharacterized membrane protein YqaE (UPF0057 family)
MSMRVLTALFLPGLSSFAIGSPITGIVCPIVQITVIGWMPATIWAVYALGQYKQE